MAPCALSSVNSIVSFLFFSDLASFVSKITGCSGLSDSLESQLGAFSQNVLSLFGATPRVPRWLGFSVVRTNLHTAASVSSPIFLTQLRTKVVHSPRFASQYSTVMLSTQLWYAVLGKETSALLTLL